MTATTIQRCIDICARIEYDDEHRRCTEALRDLLPPMGEEAIPAEPVAWEHEFTDPHEDRRCKGYRRTKPADFEMLPGDVARPLVYASPSPAVPLAAPLTEERIMDLWNQHDGMWPSDIKRFARAIEAEHGIGSAALSAPLTAEQDAITLTRDEAQAVFDALDIGLGAAGAEAAQYHEAMKGYREHEHKRLDDDAAKVNAAVTFMGQKLAALSAGGEQEGRA